MEFPSKLIEEAVNQISKLPGIGKKTALRLVLHLIKDRPEGTFALTDALSKLRSQHGLDRALPPRAADDG